jgi:hypothetical protein
MFFHKIYQVHPEKREINQKSICSKANDAALRNTGTTQLVAVSTI